MDLDPNHDLHIPCCRQCPQDIPALSRVYFILSSFQTMFRPKTRRVCSAGKPISVFVAHTGILLE